MTINLLIQPGDSPPSLTVFSQNSVKTTTAVTNSPAANKDNVIISESAKDLSILKAGQSSK